MCTICLHKEQGEKEEQYKRFKVGSFISSLRESWRIDLPIFRFLFHPRWVGQAQHTLGALGRGTNYI